MNYKNNLYITIKKSYLFSLLQPQLSRQYSIFLASMLFYLSLFGSSSNRTFLLLGLLFLLVLYILLSDFKKAVFLSFIATLPFAKGKSYIVLLLSREMITQNPLFNIEYSFPFYLSHLFIFLLAYIYLREKFRNLPKLKLNKSIFFLFLFIYLAAITAFFSTHPQVIVLTVVQIYLTDPRSYQY